MDALDYWRLCDELSVVQAAMLVVGCDPSSDAMHVEGWSPEKRPPGYEAAKTAISNALRRGIIEGAWERVQEYDVNGNFAGLVENSIDFHASQVEVASLRKWLAGRGVTTGFFFPNGRDAPDYLDPNHPRYAAKLAAAVEAWRAIQSEAITGRTPKQMLVKWLRQHAAEYGLSDEDGKPNETGIEETAKIANWQPGGGAPRTPVG